MPNVPTFRIVFPEFAETASDDQVAYWFTQATFNPARLGTSFDLAVMLFAAHNIVLGMQTAAAASKGGTPGATVAPLTSKAAGGLSASYDVNVATTEGAGIYNATSYGQRLWKLIEQAAMGGLYAAPPPRRTVFGFGNRFLR